MNSPLANADFAPTNATRARVLVADDDPGSCRFLCDGLGSMGAQAEACMDGMTALQRARTESFDLLLLDCRMPGAGALQVLAALREDAQACSTESIAVATTAELEPRDRQSLLDAGFSVLALVQPDRHDACVLDDQAALTTTGDATTMRALRLLLREELALLLQELEALSRDRTGFSERLHRLRSSCGFCGATALSTQTVLLQQQLLQRGATPVALARFRKALLATLQALDS